MKVTMYMCGVDLQHELGEASDLEGRAPLYSSVEILKQLRNCWKQCGIVKVEVNEVEWIEPQNFGEYEE